MARRSLSPNRVAQKLREHRHAVIVLARQSARKAIKAQLRAEGLKLSQFSAITLDTRTYSPPHAIRHWHRIEMLKQALAHS